MEFIDSAEIPIQFIKEELDIPSDDEKDTIPFQFCAYPDQSEYLMTRNGEPFSPMMIKEESSDSVTNDEHWNLNTTEEFYSTFGIEETTKDDIKEIMMEDHAMDIEGQNLFDYEELIPDFEINIPELKKETDENQIIEVESYSNSAEHINKLKVIAAWIRLDHDYVKPKRHEDDCTCKIEPETVITSRKKQKHTVNCLAYACNHCVFHSKFKSSLDTHMKITHGVSMKLLRSQVLGVYKCDKCIYKTSSEECLKLHVNVVHGASSQTYICGDCPYETRYEKLLSYHIKMEHTNNEIDVIM